MTWRGTDEDNRTPSQDYAINKGKYWLRFDGFNAVYAKIGIIANGLIGSAVFNGDWMFSQQGLNSTGGTSSSYESFDGDPINGVFRPNIAINFKTGTTYVNNLVARGIVKEQPTLINATDLPLNGGTYNLDISDYPNGGFVVITSTANNSPIVVTLSDDPKYDGVIFKIGFKNEDENGDADSSDPARLEIALIHVGNNSAIYCKGEYYTKTSGGSNQVYNRYKINLSYNSGLYTFIATKNKYGGCDWIMQG